MKSLHEHCLDLGFSRGSNEYKREYEAEKWRRLTPAQKKKVWDRSYQARVKRLKTDPEFLEKTRARDRLRKAKERAENKDKVNERQRANYKAAGDGRRKLINDGKRRRDPTIGIASLVKDVRAGRRDARDLVNFTSAAIEQCSALIHRGKRKGLS